MRVPVCLSVHAHGSVPLCVCVRVSACVSAHACVYFPRLRGFRDLLAPGEASTTLGGPFRKHACHTQLALAVLPGGS